MQGVDGHLLDEKNIYHSKDTTYSGLLKALRIHYTVKTAIGDKRDEKWGNTIATNLEQRTDITNNNMRVNFLGFTENGLGIFQMIPKNNIKNAEMKSLLKKTGVF